MFNKIDLSVFIPSRNRPMQLDATLRSIIPLWNGNGYFYFLYKNDEEYKLNFHKCVHDNMYNTGVLVKYIQETNFRQDLINILTECKTKYTLCLTDDSIFFSSYIDFSNILAYMDNHPEVLTYSFRLGENCKIQDPLTGSNSLSFKDNLESREFVNHQFFGKFNCTGKPMDTNLFYQISMDAHIYRTEELLNMCQSIPFNNLREWEGNLIGATRQADFIYKDKPYIACDITSAAVNLIINQQLPPYSNNVSPVYRSAEELNDFYTQGYRIDLEKTLKGIPEGSHVFRELVFQQVEYINA